MQGGLAGELCAASPLEGRSVYRGGMANFCFRDTMALTSPDFWPGIGQAEGALEERGGCGKTE